MTDTSDRKRSGEEAVGRARQTSEDRSSAPETGIDPVPEPTDFADVPRGVWRMFGLAWLVFVGVMWIAFGGFAQGAYVVAVATFLTAVYFLLPSAMIRLGRWRARARNAAHGVETHTGRLSVGAAAVQILLLPVALTLAMAIITLWAR